MLEPVSALPELVVFACLEAPELEVSDDALAVDADVEVFRVDIWTLVVFHTRPVGCSPRMLLIVESIFEPAPMYPGG